MDGLAVRVVNGDHSAKVTLVLRRTMGKNVTLPERTLKRLEAAFFVFIFGILTDFLLLLDDHRRFRTPRKTCRPGLTCYQPSPISTVSQRAKPHRGGFLKNDSACKKADFITFYVWAQVP